MNIEQQVNGPEAGLILRGRLDVRTAAGLEDAIGNLPEEVNHLTLDLSGLNYAAVIGFKVINSARLKFLARGGTLKLQAAPPQVLETLETTGLVSVFDLES